MLARGVRGHEGWGVVHRWEREGVAAAVAARAGARARFEGGSVRPRSRTHNLPWDWFLGLGYIEKEKIISKI